MKKTYFKRMAMGLMGLALVMITIGATVDTGSLGDQMVVVVDEKAANTSGGTFTSGAWQTRTLNTLTVNDDGIASLSDDQITLPAGTYEIEIWHERLGTKTSSITVGASDTKTVDFTMSR